MLAFVFLCCILSLLRYIATIPPSVVHEISTDRSSQVSGSTPAGQTTGNVDMKTASPAHPC